MPRPPNPEELSLVAEEEAIAADIAALLPGMDTPYFARLRVRTPAGERDVLLAARTLAGPTAMLVDWQTAPLAAVFLESRPGDDYEHEHAGRTLTGQVLRRHLVHFRGPTLAELRGDGFVLRRGVHGWLADDDPGPRLHPRPPAARTRPLSPAHVQLDPAQRAAVDLPPTRSLLILGEAGFGKTTVALHRLARLVRAADLPSRALVIVPTAGLQRLVVHMLGELGVAEHIEVHTFNRWISAEARRLFPDLPRRLASDVEPAVSTIKRHPALRTVFAKIVAGTPAMREVRRGYRDTPETIRDLLLHLFGDRALLTEVVEHADLPQSTIPAVLAHTRVQFTPTSERALRHVDRDRLQALDGRPLDAATPFNNCDTIDPEDLAVIFALHRRITGGDVTRHGRLASYQHILLDEAQELAPIELELISRALTPTGTLIIAGDERQQVDASTRFIGWPATLAELGQPDATVVSLAVSYRCPPAIESAARHVLDPAHLPSAGPSLLTTRHDNPCHLLTAIVDALLPLQSEDPNLAIAIVCRHPELAERLHARLAPPLRSRLVLGGAFSFRPGIDITCVQIIKGLEFNVVVIPDADARTYPDDPAARRALYVAMTRATDRCWLATAGPWSPLLAAITTPK
jgi:DNA helicase-2/ATP-dependent DNA helicase PcrA